MPLRTSLFLITNLAVVATIAVLIGSFFWGAVGSWISLQMSRESAIRGMGVQLVDENSGPETRWLVTTVAALAQKTGLPMPDVGIDAAPEFNAFATGILKGMPPAELEAVLGHELSHVGNGDMVTTSLLQGVVNAFVPFFVRLLWMALPRSTDEQGRVRAPSLLLVQPLEVLLGLLASHPPLEHRIRALREASVQGLQTVSP
jgi:heat shock protein HtpX